MSKILKDRLRAMHDRLNTNLAAHGQSFKTAAERDAELDEAMALCWKSADQIVALEAENKLLRDTLRGLLDGITPETINAAIDAAEKTE